MVDLGVEYATTRELVHDRRLVLPNIDDGRRPDYFTEAIAELVNELLAFLHVAPLDRSFAEILRAARSLQDFRSSAADATFLDWLIVRDVRDGREDPLVQRDLGTAEV